MKGTRLEVRPLDGISERIPQEPGDASEIVNFTVHRRTMGWDNRIGWERYNPLPSAVFAPFAGLDRIDSLFIWGRHQGAQSHVLFEAEGHLYFLDELSDILEIQKIQSGRTVPAMGEATTTYTPFGRFLIIVNGNDSPLKFSGWPMWINAGLTPESIPMYDLGWSAPPNAPTLWGVSTEPEEVAAGGTLGRQIGIWAGDILREIGIGTSAETDNPYEVGLGTAGVVDDQVENTYRYKVSFVNNAGSESPISEGSNTVRWATRGLEPLRTSPAMLSRMVTMVEIPTGPIGTVARRLYRTKNLKSGDPTVPEEYYFVLEVPNNIETEVFDHLGDAQLGSTAPSAADSTVFPATGARFSAVFKSRLFLDGGSANGTTLFWSNAGKPDTFSVLDFADLGMRNSGDITGLHNYYNCLIVMRERGIDLVRQDPTSGAFHVFPLSESVGTKAKDTITTIPDLGVVFLAHDGVYLLSGSTDGGGTFRVQKFSNSIIETTDAINVDVIARATATYSHKWREWHCYYAADGADRPNVGVVLHLDKIAWTKREGFPVGVVTTNSNGEIVFGHNHGDPIVPGRIIPLPSGLFVVSRRRACGQAYQQGQPNLAIDNPPCTSTYRSAWVDFGDPNIKKRVHYVYVSVLSMGDNAVGLTYFKDYSFTGTSAPSMLMQQADHLDQKVFGESVVGTDAWDNSLVSQIRYPIDEGSCSQFQFELETTNDFVIVGYAIEFTAADGMKIITGKRA